MLNRGLSFLVVGAVIGQLAIPSIALAVAQNGSAESGRSADAGREVRLVQNRLCENLEVVGAQMVNRLTEQAERLQERRGQRNGRLEETRAGRLTGLARARSEQSVRHERRLQLMLERVTDENQRTAVEEFELALDEALENRQSAVDAVMEDYLNDLDELLSGRREALDGVSAELRVQVEAAIEAAQEACDDDEDGIEVRKSLNEAIGAAHRQFLADWQSSAAVNEQIKELLTQRNEAFRTAWVEFKAEIEVARDTLKDSLSQPDDNSGIGESYQDEAEEIEEEVEVDEG